MAKAPSPSRSLRPLSSRSNTMSCVASRLPSLAAASRCALALAEVDSAEVLRLLRQHHQSSAQSMAAAAAQGTPAARPTLTAVLGPPASALALLPQFPGSAILVHGLVKHCHTLLARKMRFVLSCSLEWGEMLKPFKRFGRPYVHMSKDLCIKSTLHKITTGVGGHLERGREVHLGVPGPAASN